MSNNCTNTPNAKRKKGSPRGPDTASVVIDLSYTPIQIQKERLLAIEAEVIKKAKAKAEAEAAREAASKAASSTSSENNVAAGDDDDTANAMLEETRGCAIMDSGATVMCSSTLAAEEIQMQRINKREPG